MWGSRAEVVIPGNRIGQKRCQHIGGTHKKFCGKRRYAHALSIVLCFALTITTLSGCTADRTKELSISGFAFDTTYTITLYQGGSQKLLDSCVSKCSDYEKIFSRTLESSELYQVNEIEKCYEKAASGEKGTEAASGKTSYSYTAAQIQEMAERIDYEKSEKNTIVYEISEDGTITFIISKLLSQSIQRGLEYARKSEGRFDICIEPATSLWNFQEDTPKVPDEKAIQAALPYIDYRKVALQGQRLSFQMPGMGLDLGGIAKGFIADELKEYLRAHGVSSAIINLGGNILCLGSKANAAPFQIGVQQPFADHDKTVAAVAVKDMSVVSSGIYERYIQTKDGRFYHHIIDPKTGYSYENNLLGVTILSKKSVDGDGLSTTCFAYGKKKGLEFINSLDDVYAMFITKDEKVWYSDGFQEYLLEN